MLQDFTNSVTLKSWKQFNHLLELSTKFSHYWGVETFLQKQTPARHVYCKEEIEITVSDIKPKMLSLLHVILALNETVPALENAICSYLEQVSDVCLEPNQIPMMDFFRKGGHNPLTSTTTKWSNTLKQ